MDKEDPQGGRERHLVLELEMCNYSIILLYVCQASPNSMSTLSSRVLGHVQPQGRPQSHQALVCYTVQFIIGFL
jgi:hypothetical protein